MNWFIEIFTEPSYIQAILVLSLICVVGLLCNKIKIKGVSLGVTFVFFAGIIVGHFGLSVDPRMLALAQNFGLVLFVFTLGLQVGPSFFPSLKRGGIKLNILAFAVLLVGTLMTLGISKLCGVSLPVATGLLTGAATNTPMLGAAQQTLLQTDPGAVDVSNQMATACAVGYPFGVIGKTIRDIMKDAHIRIVVSRVWKYGGEGRGQVIIPDGDTVLEKGEHVLVLTRETDAGAAEQLFGEKVVKDWNKKDIDWNHLDGMLVSRHIFVTKTSVNGAKLGELHLRNAYRVNITRVNRAGIDLLPSRDLRLQIGDKLTIVGEQKAIDRVAEVLGNQEKELRNPNLLFIFIGLMLGLILGSLPISIPGMSVPIRLGIAGGPILIGILMGAFGPRIHLTTYTTHSANLMLRLETGRLAVDRDQCALGHCAGGACRLCRREILQDGLCGERRDAVRLYGQSYRSQLCAYDCR